MKTAIINGKIIANRLQISGKTLVVEDGKIAAICDCPVTDADVYLDAKGQYVSAGFIDLHVHGGGGSDFMDGSLAAIETICATHLRHGTTSICPTSLTCTDQELSTLFDCYAKAKGSEGIKNNLLGLHLEGPYFSAAQCGAQDPQYLLLPTPAHYQWVLSHHQDIARVSFAPELEGSIGLARALKEHGILAAVGHSDAEYAQVAQAYAEGVTHVTHLYSGMSTIKRVNAYRKLGVVEAAYLLDDMTVEIIADGKHLPPELLRLIVKGKGVDKICLVTDAIRGADLEDGTVVRLGSLEKGQDAIIEDGVAFLPDKSSFAGSVCTADRCVRTMYQQAGCKLEDAVAMMSMTPARVLHLSNTKGDLAVGMDADINIFDENINISHVLVAGKVVYTAPDKASVHETVLG